MFQSYRDQMPIYDFSLVSLGSSLSHQKCTTVLGRMLVLIIEYLLSAQRLALFTLQPEGHSTAVPFWFFFVWVGEHWTLTGGERSVDTQPCDTVERLGGAGVTSSHLEPPWRASGLDGPWHWLLRCWPLLMMHQGLGCAIFGGWVRGWVASWLILINKSQGECQPTADLEGHFVYLTRWWTLHESSLGAEMDRGRGSRLGLCSVWIVGLLLLVLLFCNWQLHCCYSITVLFVCGGTRCMLLRRR